MKNKIIVPDNSGLSIKQEEKVLEVLASIPLELRGNNGDLPDINVHARENDIPDRPPMIRYGFFMEPQGKYEGFVLLPIIGKSGLHKDTYLCCLDPFTEFKVGEKNIYGEVYFPTKGRQRRGQTFYISGVNKGNLAIPDSRIIDSDEWHALGTAHLRKD